MKELRPRMGDWRLTNRLAIIGVNCLQEPFNGVPGGQDICCFAVGF
jgi:hypothetical protein